MGKYNHDTGDARLDLALSELVAGGFGNNWSVSRKNKTLRKFGRREDLALGEIATLWQNGTDDDVYHSPVEGNLTDTISSSEAGDTQTVVIEGHEWVGTDLRFLVQRVTLNGQNKVTLPIPLCRVSRSYEPLEGGSTGDISIYDDTPIVGGIPTDLTKRHDVIKGSLGQSQSFKGSTSISSVDAMVLTSITVGVAQKQAAAVDFTIEARNAPNSHAFLPVYGRFAANSTGLTTFTVDLDPPIIIPPNSDVRIRAVSSVNNVAANGTFAGYLATKL
jgi:hypothetical protein